MTGKNSLTICGVITNPQFDHEAFGEKFYALYAHVHRLSGQEDRLPLCLPEQLLVLPLHEGDKCLITGQLRSYNFMEGEKRRLLLAVFCKSIQPVPPETEDVNEVLLQGYLCKKPIYRVTPLSREIADMLLAVNRPYGKSDYIPCIAWGRNAQYADTLPVGSMLQLTGRLQSRDYQKQTEAGTFTRTAYELSVAKLALAAQEDPAV